MDGHQVDIRDLKAHTIALLEEMYALEEQLLTLITKFAYMLVL